ncbi:MAG TPA: DegQ family serine endoprotease [Nitrospiria bacterium]|nr:DegQ family serine endoprotease [Nitrospiria bacterium]
MPFDSQGRPERGGERRVSVRQWIVGSVMISIGIMIGLLLATDIDWFPSVRTVQEPTASATSPAPAPLRTGGPPPPASASDNQLFVKVAESATPAVVNVSTSRVIKGRQGGSQQNPMFEDPFFRRFFGDDFFRQFQTPPSRREQSLGSGVIVDPNGYIVTNNHVVAQADEIKVLLADKREFTGKVVGSDPKTDVAVVKIDAKDLPTIPWGDSGELKVGEYVLAIGNPFGLNQTVTMGIISAVGRANVGIADYEDFIQTDAAINPGNSGGALVNTRGQLIGVNTAIFSRSGGYMGIGFAVPSNMVRLVMTSLIKEGKVTRGWLGVSIQEVTSELAKQFGLQEAKGALVSDVLKDTPADRAGLKRGDIVIKHNGHDIANAGQLRNLVAETEVGRQVDVTIIRDKREKTLTIKIDEQPKELAGGGGGSPAPSENEALSGLEVQQLTPDLADQLNLPHSLTGVVITTVEDGSLAEEAGVRAGDVMVEINRQAIKSLNDYQRIGRQLKPGESVLLLLNRNGQMLFVTLSP